MVDVDVLKEKGLIFDVIRRLFGGIGRAHQVAKLQGLEIEDLLQVGYMALLIAADRYTPQKGKWSTFAYKYIKGYILNELNQSQMIKMPTSMSLEEKLEKGKVESLHEDNPYQEGHTLIENLPSPEEDFTEKISVYYDFEQMIKKYLSPKERELLFQKLYYDKTDQQIAQDEGCTRRNISRIINNALKKIPKEKLTG